MIALTPARDALRELVEHVADRPLRHATAGRGFLSGHAPWWVRVGDGCAGQRPFLRSTACIRCIVAGRQSGKTHQVAEEVVRIILRRPKTESCLLMPTYKSTKGALRHLRRALEPLGGRVTWKEQDKAFLFPNGSTLYVRTADDKTGVPTRGLTLDGVLWVDEASFVPRSAWDAAQNTLAAVQDPIVIVTSTPLGRNTWVFELCRDAASGEDPEAEFFRFRTTDSPFHNATFVERLRKRLGPKRAQEELDAVFLGDTDLPFPADLVGNAFQPQGLPIRGKRFGLGVDLGKKNDYTAIVLSNEFGEFWLLDLFREERETPDHMFWPMVERRVVDLAERYQAIVAVDASGGHGSNMADYLTRALGEARVHRILTGNPKLKAELFEALISDFEAGRIKLDGAGMHADTWKHELTFFPPPERVLLPGGVAVLRYVGQPDDDEDDATHDDTVLALVLARWVAINGWDRETGDGGLASFRPAKQAGSSGFGSVGRGGYIFRGRRSARNRDPGRRDEVQPRCLRAHVRPDRARLRWARADHAGDAAHRRPARLRAGPEVGPGHRAPADGHEPGRLPGRAYGQRDRQAA